MKNYKLATKLTLIRTSCGKTQQQMATKLGVACRTVQHYETGYTTPSLDILKEYLKIGKVSWDYLLSDEDTVTSEIVSQIMLQSPEFQKKLLDLLKTIPTDK